jgi:hypothetical protein
MAKESLLKDDIEEAAATGFKNPVPWMVTTECPVRSA